MIQVLNFDARYRGTRRPMRELPGQVVELRRLPACHHFDPAVREVPRMPAQPELPRRPRHEPAEPDALHAPADEVPAGHVAGRRRPRIISTMMGRTESPMMARITRVKFAFTAGMLPKKYPASVNSDTHATAPPTL